MRATILAALVVALVATTGSAVPISLGYLMISGGETPGAAGFETGTSVLIVPFPDYMPGQFVSFDPTTVPGFEGAFADASSVWFLGGIQGGDSTPIVPPWSTLLLSHEPGAPFDPATKPALLDALNALVDRDPGAGYEPLPFALTGEDYASLFDVPGFSLSDPVELDPITLSKSVSSPSTEVDIFEHSIVMPGQPIIVTVGATDPTSGRITRLDIRIVPEPTSLALLGAGLLGVGILAVRRRRRR